MNKFTLFILKIEILCLCIFISFLIMNWNLFLTILYVIIVVNNVILFDNVEVNKVQEMK